MSDCKWDARASKFASFPPKTGSRRQFSAFGPEKRRIPARRACHRLSPLRHRLSPLRHRSLWGRKVRKRLGKAKPAPRLRSDFALARAWCRPGAGLAWCRPGARLRAWWCGPGAGLVRAWRGLVRVWCGSGAGLVRAWLRGWCGPGAGLAILLWAQDCCLNPAVATGLFRPFLRHTQDCPDAAPAALAWSCSCPSTAL